MTVVANNRKAAHDYFILETYEAGIVLFGWEIKAIRAHKIQLRDSYARAKNGEMWLLGCHISPLISTSTHEAVDPVRTRKLLLNKREINKIYGRCKKDNCTVIPIEAYFKSGKIKILIALAKGKKLYDKRNAIKQREQKLLADRVTKHSRMSHAK